MQSRLSFVFDRVLFALVEPDYLENDMALSEDSLTTEGVGFKVLYFNGELTVIYNNMKKSRDQMSEIYLLTSSPVRIEKNGAYFLPQELVSIGYWGSHEKICNEIPLGYQFKGQ